MPLSHSSLSSQPDTDRTIIPAATLVILRKAPHAGHPPEILMVQRAQQMRFAGGATVFPGGRVDPSDRDLANRLLPDDDPDMASARIAAIRETLEETGLLVTSRTPIPPECVREGRALLLERGELAPVLEQMGWTLDPASLTFFAHWCPDMAKAFDTRFFLTDLGSGQVDIAVDQTENTHMFWASAADTLASAEHGERTVIFPTLCNLEKLARYRGIEDALRDLERCPPRRIVPWIETRAGEDWLVIPDDLGYPLREQVLKQAQRD